MQKRLKIDILFKDLNYEQAVKAQSAFDKMFSNYTSSKCFNLCVLCSSEKEDKSVFASAFTRHRKNFPLDGDVDSSLLGYLTHHFKYQPQNRNLSEVIKDKLNVRVITSERSGTGKSLYIRRQIERCQEIDPNVRSCCVSIKKQTLPFEDVFASLKEFEKCAGLHRVYHIDIAYEVWYEVDYFLFNLLVLGVIESKSGRLFRRRPNDLIYIEIMAPKFKAQ